MTPRIQKLRQESLDAVNRITAERGKLVTDFYKSGVAAAEPVPVQRAMCFDYILSNKHIYVGEGELIVGERGPAPGTPHPSSHTLGAPLAPFPACPEPTPTVIPVGTSLNPQNRCGS